MYLSSTTALRLSIFCAFVCTLLACNQTPPPTPPTPLQARYILQREGAKLHVVDFSQLEKHLQTPPDNKLRVLHFWATWCEPCLRELPNWDALIPEYKNRPVEWVFVDLSKENEIETQTLDFLLQYKNLRPALHLNPAESETWMHKVHPDWQTNLPMTLFLKGEQKMLLEKKISAEELKFQLEAFLK